MKEMKVVKTYMISKELPLILLWEKNNKKKLVMCWCIDLEEATCLEVAYMRMLPALAVIGAMGTLDRAFLIMFQRCLNGAWMK